MGRQVSTERTVGVHAVPYRETDRSIPSAGDEFAYLPGLPPLVPRDQGVRHQHRAIRRTASPAGRNVCRLRTARDQDPSGNGNSVHVGSGSRPRMLPWKDQLWVVRSSIVVRPLQQRFGPCRICRIAYWPDGLPLKTREALTSTRRRTRVEVRMPQPFTQSKVVRRASTSTRSTCAAMTALRSL